MLRPVETEDLDFIHQCMNDPDVWRPALGPDPVTREQIEEWYERQVAGESGVHCLVCDGETPVGHVSLSESQYGPDETSRARSAELAYYLRPDYHGEGYGSDAAGRLVQYAFEDRNLRRLSARPGGFNDASVALLESLGFEREGVLREAAYHRGEYYDMYWYGLLRENWDG